jgi:pseudomonalisin
MMSLLHSRTTVFSIGLLFPFCLLAQQDRIAGRLDPAKLAVVKGSVHPKARPENDRGPVSPSLELPYITLSLKPTPGQQADLDRLLAEQQDPASPNHRKWLTPEQYADRFGASRSDIAQIVQWLESQGLTVVSTARGRNFVVFKGTAGQVEAALHVEIHNFLVDGEMQRQFR